MKSQFSTPTYNRGALCARNCLPVPRPQLTDAFHRVIADAQLDVGVRRAGRVSRRAHGHGSPQAQIGFFQKR